MPNDDFDALLNKQLHNQILDVTNRGLKDPQRPRRTYSLDQ